MPYLTGEAGIPDPKKGHVALPNLAGEAGGPDPKKGHVAMPYLAGEAGGPGPKTVLFLCLIWQMRQVALVLKRSCSYA